MRNLIYSLITLSCLILSPSTIALDKDLIIYFSFDEISGDVVKNRGSLKGEGKLIKNPKIVDGKLGKALMFGGEASGQYVQVDHQPALDADKAVTAMSWIYPNSWPHMGSCCDQVWGAGVHGGCGGRVQWGLFQEGDLKARFETTGGRLDVPTALPEEKKWTHVAITYDNGDGKIFIDGKLAGQGKVSGAFQKSNEPLMIAADCERLNYIFDGIIDEFRLYHRALSEEEIAKTMLQKGLAIDAPRKLAINWGFIKLNK